MRVGAILLLLIPYKLKANIGMEIVLPSSERTDRTPQVPFEENPSELSEREMFRANNFPLSRKVIDCLDIKRFLQNWFLLRKLDSKGTSKKSGKKRSHIEPNIKSKGEYLKRRKKQKGIICV